MSTAFLSAAVASPGQQNQAQQLFGVRIPDEFRCGDETDDAGYRRLCEALMARFGCETVVLSERRTYAAEDNRICGKILTGGEFCTARQYRIDIVDRVGGGDALDAGMIYALRNGMTAQQAIGGVLILGFTLWNEIAPGSGK